MIEVIFVSRNYKEANESFIALESTIDDLDNIIQESTASDVESKMEYIRDDIKIFRSRLQEAIEDDDKRRIYKICDSGIKALKGYYKEIEDIPETVWENVGLSIISKLSSFVGVSLSLVSFIVGLKTPNKTALQKLGTASSGLSTIATLVDKVDKATKEINYRKINDQRMGNRNRKLTGNQTKEKALKLISDNIFLLEAVKKKAL